MKIYLNNFIGENENALFSLMFDDLPIGDPNNKMSFFTNDELTGLFDTDSSGDFDPSKDDWKSKYDFKDMREKVVNRIIERVQEENKKAKPAEVGYFNDPDASPSERGRRITFARNTTRLFSLLMGSKDKSVKDIVSDIANKSHLAGSISLVENGTTILPDEKSIGLTAVKAFDIKKLVEEFKKTGDPNNLVERLLLELGPSKADRSAVYNDLWNYYELDEESKLKQIKKSGQLRPEN